MTGRGFWALAIGLLLCSGPVRGDDISAKEKAWYACCEKAFHSCGGDAGDERGHFDLQGGQVYDYYGNTAKLNGSPKLKAVQQCIDKTCPYVVDSNTTPQPAEEKRLPIVFLPGVAGTILESGNSEVWPFAPTGTRVDLGLEPDGKTSVTGARIRVGDILRRSPKTNFYGDFIESLERLGYKENADLFPFPYDWRYDNATHFAELDELIARALAKNPRAKHVILIAHSMGGVIARAYVYSSPARAAKVDSFITMGTPYWGSPKVYYSLVNGYQFGNPSVRQELMKILMQNYPAGYQLLPQIPFINDGETRQLSLDEANSIHYKWFVKASMDVVDHYTWTSTNDRFFNPALLEQAKQFWSIVGRPDRPRPLPAGVKQYVVTGTGVSTLGGFDLQDWQGGFFAGSYLEIGNRKVVMHPRFVDGDGTVPLWSLETSAASATYYVPYKSGFFSDESTAHGDLPANKTIQGIVAEIVRHENGTGAKLPDPKEYPRPAQWEDRPFYRAKDLEDGSTFELHSDAHLRITSTNGKTLGFNQGEGIDETLPGTFLAMDGVEYASVEDINAPLKLTVTGLRPGKFTLDVAVKRASKQLSKFSYREVPVVKGTVAQVSLTPSQSAAPPPLGVTGSGKTFSVPATMTVAGGTNAARPTQSPQLGIWKLNASKSRLDRRLPRNLQIAIVSDGENIKITVDRINPDGKRLRTEWIGRFDGRFYPVLGRPNQERSYRQLDPRTLEIAVKNGGKVTDTGRSTVSSDGRTLTITVHEGQITGVSVYDKQ